MSVIKKVVTLLRGSARELAENVVDANATRIYEQEIIDAKQSILEARSSLADVMAKEMQSGRAVTRLEGEMTRYEGLALEALEKSQEALAEEVAGKVAAIELELEEQRKAQTSFAAQVSKLKELIKASEAKIREHEREIAIAKTTESVYKATQSISDNIGSSGSRLASARESLERIKQRHEHLADRMQAADQLDRELGEKALATKLAEAGIGQDADRQRKVMERIRARQAKPTGEA
jgi:phage shock protein A